MIAHLKDRAAALAALGWTGKDAEWLALVCLHSGAFLRSQYLAFTGDTHRSAATRFLERCGGAAVEEPWNGPRQRLCRIVSRPVYRALGAEHVRHRREASGTVRLRRLLSLDYVLDHPELPWLATEEEKVTALTTAGVPEAVLPRRVYVGQGNSYQKQTRYFVHKLPVALDAHRATFVFTTPMGDKTQDAARTWGGSHAAVWDALRAHGRTVSVVVVGPEPARLAAAHQLVNTWTTPEAAAAGEEPAGDADAAELAALRAAVADTDAEALHRRGGLDAVLDRIVALEDAQAVQPATDGPHIARAALWRSVRVGP